MRIMQVNTNQQSPNFKGTYYKLYSEWENIAEEMPIKKPIENIIKEAKDVVILSVSGKGRYHNIMERMDATFKNTPVVLTDQEASDYRFLIEQTETKPRIALSYILRQSLEIFKPKYKITQHESFESLKPFIVDGESFEDAHISTCKFIKDPDDSDVVYRKYYPGVKYPSKEARIKLKTKFEEEQLAQKNTAIDTAKTTENMESNNLVQNVKVTENKKSGFVQFFKRLFVS